MTPGRFSDVVGHGPVLALLEEEVERPAQSYLFVGPDSTGKGTVARLFSAALLCGSDPDCLRRAIAGNHPDLTLVEPEGRSAITVDQARSTVSLASLAPLEADRKVFLFEEGGLMNDEAANALLKTLEEPSASTVFVIVAESEDDLPATIASRCRTVVFGRVAEEEVEAGLVRRGVSADQAEQVARISGGRPGLAIALATRAEVGEYRRLWLSIPLRLPDHPGDAFRLADEVAEAAAPLLAALKDRQAMEVERIGSDGVTKALKDRQDRELKRATLALFTTGLEILAGFYRDAAAAQFGAPVRNPDIPVVALTRVVPSAAMRNAERVLETIESLRANQRPQLALAALFSELSDHG